MKIEKRNTDWNLNKVKKKKKERKKVSEIKGEDEKAKRIKKKP